MADATSGATSSSSASESLDESNAAVFAWRRSSFCGSNGACVELAPLDGGAVALRDGKIAEPSPVLVFESAEWAAFIAGVKNGEFG